MSATPIQRQQAALRAATAILRHWDEPGVSVNTPLPENLADAAAVLAGTSGLDVLRVVRNNTPLLSALMR